MRRSDPPSVLDHIDGLSRYALSLTRNAEDAEDLVHDALVRALHKRQTLRTDGDVRSWLFSILHNAFVDNLRRRKAESARVERASRIAPRSAEPSQEHAAEIARVQSAFGDLPTEQRAVLHLVVSEGLTYAEVAKLLNVPLGTVMSRLARARASLRGAGESCGANPVSLRVVGGRG